MISFDNYDGRTLLDDLPEEVPIKYNYFLEYNGEDKELETMLNFERYRMLVEAFRTSGDLIITHS